MHGNGLKLALSMLAAFGGSAFDIRAQEKGWHMAPAMPSARSEVHAAILDGCIHVAGGIAGHGTTAAFECLDVAGNAWRKLAAAPVAVHHAPLAALAGRVWLSGGYTSLTFSFNDPVLWAFDPTTNRWSTAAAMLGRRAAHVMAALGDSLIIAAGVGDRPEQAWSYHPGTGRWRTDLAPLPRPVEHAAGAVHDGKLWIFGGRWRGQGELRTVFAYDAKQNAWRSGPDMPEPRAGHAAAVLAGKAYLFGGERLGDGRVETEMLVLDFASGRWTRAARGDSPRIPRHGIAATAAGRCAWLIGGGTAAGWRTLFTASDAAERFCP